MRPLRFTSEALRRTARAALLAWVFALMSGLANACLIQPVAPVERQVGHVHHPAADASTGPDADAGMAACLKFCADESSALAKSKALQADLSGTVALPSVQWQWATPVAAVTPWHSVERPASVGPPLFLRLLRLTI